MRVLDRGLLALAAAGGLGLLYKVRVGRQMPCVMSPDPPPHCQACRHRRRRCRLHFPVACRPLARPRPAALRN